MLDPSHPILALLLSLAPQTAPSGAGGGVGSGARDGDGSASRPASRPADGAEAKNPAPRPAKDFAGRAAELRKKYSAGGFSVVAEPPFVVIGDESDQAVRRWASSTVRWAVDRLKLDFFEKDPEGILDVWLFKDRASYEKNTQEIFGEEPTTPYGYYTQRHGALIMNIGTGGGTLVHEIVHPFVHANFPTCPAWFNEGLGSLFEHCMDRGGHIVGLPNWRLPALQDAIRDKSLRSTESLVTTTDDEFYGEARGLNYAQARYLCYYLQERGLLVKFYREFRAGAERDPSGLRTLKSVLGATDLAAFDREWRTSVSALRYP